MCCFRSEAELTANRRSAAELQNEMGLMGLSLSRAIERDEPNAALRTLDAIHLGVARTEGLEIASNDKTLLNAAQEFNIPTVEI